MHTPPQHAFHDGQQPPQRCAPFYNKLAHFIILANEKKLLYIWHYIMRSYSIYFLLSPNLSLLTGRVYGLLQFMQGVGAYSFSSLSTIHHLQLLVGVNDKDLLYSTHPKRCFVVAVLWLLLGAHTLCRTRKGERRHPVNDKDQLYSTHPKRCIVVLCFGSSWSAHCLQDTQRREKASSFLASLHRRQCTSWSTTGRLWRLTPSQMAGFQLKVEWICRER